MIDKAEPAARVLQENVHPLLDGLPLLGEVPVVPHVLSLEVLVYGQVDRVVGGGQPLVHALILLDRQVLLDVEPFEAHGGLGG